jgi:hypothetical protein
MAAVVEVVEVRARLMALMPVAAPVQVAVLMLARTPVLALMPPFRVLIKIPSLNLPPPP